jgi:predicted amidohydrolase
MPAAFTVPTGRAHWETLLRARAIENLCYVVAPAQAGTHTSGRETYGDSLIVDYWGQVLSRLAKGYRSDHGGYRSCEASRKRVRAFPLWITGNWDWAQRRRCWHERTQCRERRTRCSRSPRK